MWVEPKSSLNWMPSYEGEGVLFWLVTSDLKLVKWWVIVKKKHYNWVADILCGHKWTPAVMVKAKRINSISPPVFHCYISTGADSMLAWSQQVTYSLYQKKCSKEEMMSCRHSFSKFSHPQDCSGSLFKKRKQEKPTKIEKWSLFAGLNALNILL